MILSIVLALIIFFIGIPIATALFIALCKAVVGIFDTIIEVFFEVFDTIALMLGRITGLIIHAWRIVRDIVRTQVQNLG
jgi:phage-related protein